MDAREKDRPHALGGWPPPRTIDEANPYASGIDDVRLVLRLVLQDACPDQGRIECLGGRRSMARPPLREEHHIISRKAEEDRDIGWCGAANAKLVRGMLRNEDKVVEVYMVPYGLLYGTILILL